MGTEKINVYVYNCLVGFSLISIKAIQRLVFDSPVSIIRPVVERLLEWGEARFTFLPILHPDRLQRPGIGERIARAQSLLRGLMSGCQCGRIELEKPGR